MTCFKIYLSIIVFSLFIYTINSANICTFEKIEYPTSPVNRVILRYKCTTGSNPNPIIPSDIVSTPADFNELDLSPNLFTTLPSNQLCQYINLYQLDLSQNQIINMTERFKTLSCLNSLTRLDLSSNAISSPLMDNDFDNSLRKNLKWLSLSNNRIPSIDSNAFMYSNGTTKFPNLSYLDLSYNLIKVLDILWPMSIPDKNLFIDLSTNPIETLKNQLNAQFTSSSFIPMTNNRSVDVTDNNIVLLDDTQLWQYNIGTSSNFQILLTKLSNFDFRQTTNKLTCFCPITTGLYTVYWYGLISKNFVNNQSPIFQLYCSNINNKYIFDFNCTFIGTTTSTTTTTTTVITTNTSTTTTITVPKTTNTIITANSTNSTSVELNQFGQLVGGSDNENANSNSTTTTITRSNNNYFLLLILLIPISIILLFLFFCVCGRGCLYRFYDICSINLCPCFRPDEMSNKSGKKYDTVFCYGEHDENWLEELFIPIFSDYDRGYKIHKTKIDPSSQFAKDQAEILKRSRRIVILFSEKFLAEEWKNNTSFKESLKELCHTDSNLILVPVFIDMFTKEEVDGVKSVLDSYYMKGDKVTGKFANFKDRMIQNLMRNTGLEDVESLDWNDDNFWKKFNYIMPLVKNRKRPTEITETSKYRKLNKNMKDSNTSLQSEKLQKAADVSASTNKRKNSFESIGKHHRDSFIVVNNELPLITNLKNSFRRDSRVEPVDDDRLPSMKMNLNNDHHLTYSRSYSNSRGVFGPKEIIPINLDLERFKQVDQGDKDFWQKIETVNPESDRYEPVSNQKDDHAYLDRFGINSIDIKRVKRNVPKFEPKSNESTNFRDRSKSPKNKNKKKLLNLDSTTESGSESSNPTDEPSRLLIIPTGVFTQLGKTNEEETKNNLPFSEKTIDETVKKVKNTSKSNDQSDNENDDPTKADYKVNYDTYSPYDASDIQTQPKYKMPKKLVPISAENREIEYDEEPPIRDTQQIENEVRKNPKKVIISDKIDYNENNDQFDNHEQLESVKSEKKKKKKSKKHKNKDRHLANSKAVEENDDLSNNNNNIEHNQADQDENEKVDF